MGRCQEASVLRSHFEQVRLTGTDLSRAALKDVAFVGCKLDLANFRFAKLERVKFIDCMLHETDFQGAGLTNVVFQNCQLEKVEFAQCNLKDVDARSSWLYNIRGWSSLRGLILDTSQLVTLGPELALELGLRIEGE